jgi:hypothetical protein
MLDQEITYWRWSLFYHLEQIFYEANKAECEYTTLHFGSIIL